MQSAINKIMLIFDFKLNFVNQNEQIKCQQLKHPLYLAKCNCIESRKTIRYAINIIKHVTVKLSDLGYFEYVG
jgi:hypothetical protein